MAKKVKGFIKYNTYSFVDKDPSIDVVRTAKARAGLTDTQIALASNLSSTTLKSWFDGKTKRPQFATIAAAAVACGLNTIPLTSEGRKKYKDKA